MPIRLPYTTIVSLCCIVSPSLLPQGSLYMIWAFSHHDHMVGETVFLAECGVSNDHPA